MNDSRLVRMTEAPYEAEELLQRHLVDYPDLLAGDQIDPTRPRRWLLVRREIAIPDDQLAAGRWSLDHLFLDQDGIPTLVEVKRSSDTRSRREVVAQMLDYAANGVSFWPERFLEATFRESCQLDGDDPDQRLADFLEPGHDPAVFWQVVDGNLRANRIRLIFLADVISVELHRIIQFLAQQFRDVEVLAIEVRQFLGGGHAAFVPRLLNEPAAIARRPASRSRPPVRHWDREPFFAEIASLPDGHELADVAANLIAWATEAGLRVRYGGVTSPTAQLGPPEEMQAPYWMSLWNTQTETRLEIRFNYIRLLPELTDSTAFDRLVAALSQIPGFDYDERELQSRPGRPLRLLTAPAALGQLTRAFDALIAAVRQTPG